MPCYEPARWRDVRFGQLFQREDSRCPQEEFTARFVFVWGFRGLSCVCVCFFFFWGGGGGGVGFLAAFALGV